MVSMVAMWTIPYPLAIFLYPWYFVWMFSDCQAGKFTLPGLVMIKTRKKKATKAGKKMMFGKEVKVKAQPAKTVAWLSSRKAFTLSFLFFWSSTERESFIDVGSGPKQGRQGLPGQGN